MGSTERGAFYRHGALLFVVWRDVPDIADIRAMAKAAMACKAHGPFAVVQQLAPSSAMPDAETRAAIISTWLGVGHDLIAMDMVLMAQGFWASAARAVINGMIIAARFRAPIRVSAALGEHTAWLRERLRERVGSAMTEAEILAAVREASRLAQLA